MQYVVTRNDQTYGPYTLEDLRRYLASGHVLASDLARSQDETAEGAAASSEWIPVAQLLGLGAAPVQPGWSAVGAPDAPPLSPGAAGGGYAVAPFSAFLPPPNLNWVLLLFFGIFTGGLFTIIYDLIQAAWLRRVYPPSRVLLFYILCAVCWFLNITISLSSSVYMVTHHVRSHMGPIGGLFSLAYLILLLVARFTMRSELEQHFNSAELIGLRLSGIMTFFFGGLYFQYHFNRINELRRASMAAMGYVPR